MGLFRALIIGAFILVVPLALITTNIRVAISEQPVYDYAVRHYGAEQASGIPQAELLRANDTIHDYLVNSRSGALSITVIDQQGQAVSLFNIKETAHMADVRDLVGVLFLVQALALAGLIALAVVMLAMWPPRALAAAALYGSVLTAGILAMAALLSLSGFDAAWSQFHGIAFTNDFWELDPSTDHLIQMFPEAFWFDITMLIGVATMAEAVLISACSVGYLMLSRPRGERKVTPEPRPALPRPPYEERQRHITAPDPRHWVR
ncbi:MAG TPA: TIGR01906 family membrane protein [Dehalococcoidia bacterium]|nr:TIGR01906 family membrane protein [Dehalococcoidia bacterium]